jgi:hypothetical protein
VFSGVPEFPRVFPPVPERVPPFLPPVGAVMTFRFAQS